MTAAATTGGDGVVGETDRPANQGGGSVGKVYARDGFETGARGWACVCSTEEMVFNKMLRRDPTLFSPDRFCDAYAPYHDVSKSERTTTTTQSTGRIHSEVDTFR